VGSAEKGARLFDVLFCEGASMGRGCRASCRAREEEIVVEYGAQAGPARPRDVGAAMSEFSGLDLSRTFSREE